MTDEQRDEAQAERHGEPPTMVVGLGASAGGIQALQTFFRHVAPDAPVAFVVVLHLSPEHDSKFAEVSQISCALPVTQVRDAEILRRGHVYVIPPNQILEVSGRHLRLSPMTRPEQRRGPVDLFFRTLAEAYGPRAAAVVLSGTGSNGSSGLKRVKEHGGLTIAQVPREAEYGDMPYNSIATGLVDFVLSVAEMPRQILRYNDRLPQELSIVTDPPAPDSAEEAAGTIDDLRSAHEWREILTVLRVRTGQDFVNYKAATLRRRVERRLNVRGLTSLGDYARLLREHPDEPSALMRELLISVTNFFRDGEAYAALERRVIPLLFQQRPGGEQVRLWSAGCATGEEAYSLAMLVAEYTSTLVDTPAVQVFATDLDEQAIAHAREGLYGEADVVDLPPERLQRFFQKETGGYRVRRELREMVLFAHHNVLRDPPFSHLDLISCRNLLIYLNRAAQERVLETFHFALRTPGYLFLGSSESAEGETELFVPIDKSAHIYESRTVSTRRNVSLIERAPQALPHSHRAAGAPPSAERILPGDLHLRLLEQFGPPSLVCNEDHILLHTSPSAAPFLRLAGGEPSRDVMKLVLPELRADLRTALHLAAQQRAPVAIGGIRVPSRGSDAAVKVTVRPALRDDDPPRGYYLVLFEDEVLVAEEQAPVPLRSVGEPESRVEDELLRVKAQLRTTIAQYETHSEEARATTEELQAMNEELRSSAEELETSKEELQSVNEELTTVNQELKTKIEELRLANNDFRNLINSSDVGTIFLDRSLRVKMSTPAAQSIFNLLPTDIGRKLSDITSSLLYESLLEDVVQVLNSLQTIERDVRTKCGRSYLMRLLPYRTTDDRIEGVVITFLDITEWRQAERRVLASDERLRLLIERVVDYAIFTMTDDGTIDSWNAGAERMFGYSAAEIVGQQGARLFTPEDRAAGIPDVELATAREKGRASDDRWHIRKDGTHFYCSGVTMRVGDGAALGFTKIARDLTAQQRAEMDLQEARADLEVRVASRTAELRAEVAQRAAAQDHALALLRKVVTAQEDERRRLARDLHDQLGQQLTGLRLALERAVGRLPADARPEVQQALSLTAEIDREIDYLAWELRPAVLDDLGLAAALPRYLERWSDHANVVAQFHLNGDVADALTSDQEAVFYRVAQEALTNVAKHAQATRVDLLLERRDGTLVLLVEDNGNGFDPAEALVHPDGGLGLIGMQERARMIGATLQIESSDGNGTSVYLRVPVAEKPRT